ncbi:MAG: ABC transporter ATP-binding protein [Bacteroidota bacterium]
MNTNLLTLSNVNKRYGDRLIVDSLSFSVAQGSITALLGPNGAGKTTTMKMCAGLFSPDSGSISIAGFDLNVDRRTAQGFTTFLPENVALYTELTGRENLAHLLEISTGIRLSNSDLDKALVVAGLPAEAISRNVSTYSKGMRQKVGIALALAKEAKLLLLDEPTSGLDPHSATEFNRAIHEVAGRGASVLMATHDIWRAREVADRLLVMVQGRLAVEFDPKTLSAEEIERQFFLNVR